MSETTARRPNVVIIGGGFAGIQAAKRLRKAPVNLTLIDRRNHHLFQPLLYQVATAALSPTDIAHPIRRILRSQCNTEVVHGEVTHIDAARKILEMADGTERSYDYLILAAGAQYQYFGHDAWAPYAPGLKSIEDALTIRRRMLLAFERAEYETDPEERAALMTFVVIGGGPTGVELAGTFSDVARATLAKDFRHIDPTTARVILIEGGERVLGQFVESLSASAQRQLETLGVEVHTGVRASEINGQGVRFGDDQWVETRTICWAGGLAASPLTKSLDAPCDRGGRIQVEPDLSVPGHPEIFATGDLIHLTQPDGSLVPGLAPAAMQTGRHAADNIKRTLEGKPSEPFHYLDKGTMATIGRKKAVADIRGLRFSGVLAWLAWLFVHLIFLIDFRNRLVVLIEWAWSYMTYDRGARLITQETEDAVIQEQQEQVRLRRDVHDGPPAIDSRVSCAQASTESVS